MASSTSTTALIGVSSPRVFNSGSSVYTYPKKSKVSKLALETIDSSNKNEIFRIRNCRSLSKKNSQQLKLEDMFPENGISGATIHNIKFSPDSNRFAFFDSKSQGKVFLYDIKEEKAVAVFDTLQLPELDNEEVDDIFWMPCSKNILVLQGKAVYSVDLSEKNHTYKIISISKNKKLQMTLSPTGKHLAYLNTHNIYIIDIESETEMKITLDGKKTKKNGFAEYAAWMDLDRNTGYWWSPDGQYIAYIQTEEKRVKSYYVPSTADDASDTIKMHLPFAGEANARVTLRYVDVKTGESHLLDIGNNKDIYIARVEWLPDGTKVAVQILSRDQKKLNLLLCDIKTKKSHLVLSEKSETWVNCHDDLYFLTNSQFFIWSSERSGYKHLYLYEINGKLLKQLTAGEWTLSRLVDVDEATGIVYFEGYVQSSIERHLYQTSIANENPNIVTKITRGAGSHTVSFSPDCTYFVDTFSKAHLPPSISLCNVREQARLHWIQRNKVDRKHPYYHVLSHFKTPKFGTFKTAEGVDLIYSVIRPAHFDKKKKYPVITVVYGGPCVRLVKNEWKDYQFIKVAQYMADRGYVIFSVDNRGSSERGKAFEDPIYGKMGSVEVEDQKAGIEMLKTKYSWIDPERIGIMGHSYGGYMTLMAMMKEPDIFKAGYAGAPWVDPKEYNACYTERFLGDPKANKKGYKESCVLTHARKLKGPVYVAAGKLDDNVLWERHASRLLDALHKWGHPFDMTLLPDEKHSFKDPNNNIHLYTSVVQFFDKHLSESR